MRSETTSSTTDRYWAQPTPARAWKAAFWLDFHATLAVQSACATPRFREGKFRLTGRALVPDADRRTHSCATNSSIFGSRATHTCNGRDRRGDHGSSGRRDADPAAPGRRRTPGHRERAGLATAAIAHIVEREAAASLALLDGLASTPSLHSGDYKSLYEQLRRRGSPREHFYRRTTTSVRSSIRCGHSVHRCHISGTSPPRPKRLLSGFTGTAGAFPAELYRSSVCRRHQPECPEQWQALLFDDGHTRSAIAGTREDAGGTRRLGKFSSSIDTDARWSANKP